jgi:tRNA-dihydrouridine synthase
MLQTGADGVMVGRGIFTNPWFFAATDVERDVDEKVELLENHIRMYTNTWQSKRNFSILKRFFKIYVNGFSGASAFRASLMETHQAEEALQVIREFRENHFHQTGS